MSFPGTNIPNRQSLFRSCETGEFENEPTSDNISWVTVELPSSLSRTYTEQMILEYVIDEIRSYRACIDRVAQHAFRYECISLPIDDPPASYTPLEVMHEVMAQAAVLAEYWLIQIRAGKYYLDKERIFSIGFMDPHHGEETEC
ncbi:hypothetical protein PENCOP_c009G07140 [Penicillium coprophilum]|uniref:Uncharacterized protein n=1 Tax=Penicillium coprophilum TaxID=36646 RepID=A0A1V6UHK2_9EURO|nr:hypothetical protein PENCOP_c009G07140 [Penicillium coprophilum]